MTGFLRPEAVALLRRWQGVLSGAAVAGLGLYWLVFQPGALRLIGAVLAIAGAGLLVQAVIRLRIRPPETGVGLVEITERQLSYFHPMQGASLSLDAVERVEIRTMPRRRPGRDAGGAEMFWVLHHDDGPPVVIPAGAAGAERLMDAVAAFPGADFGQVIAGSRATGKGVFHVWSRRPETPLTPLPRR